MKYIDPKYIAEMLGEDEVIKLQSRFAFTVREKMNAFQITMAGVAVSVIDDLNYNKEGMWERLDCDLLVIPKAKYILKSDSSLRSAKLDILAMSMDKPEHWKLK